MRAKSEAYALVFVISLLLLATTCNKNTNTQPQTSKTTKQKQSVVDECAQLVRKMKVNEKSQNIVYTYVDANGEFHSVENPKDVPVEFSNDVIITDLSKTPEERKSDKCAIVADLQRTDEEGNFVLRAEPRADFERAIQLKRKYRLTTVSAIPSLTSAKPIKISPNTDKVILYSASWCGYCKKMRALLKQLGVKFEEKDVERTPDAAAELAAKLQKAGAPQAGVPVLDYKGRLIIGYDPVALKQAIKELGLPK